MEDKKLNLNSLNCEIKEKIETIAIKSTEPVLLFHSSGAILRMARLLTVPISVGMGIATMAKLAVSAKKNSIRIELVNHLKFEGW